MRAEARGLVNQTTREQEGTLYPDINDEAFLKKLLKKREFKETRQPKITDETLKNNVCDVEEFEYTSSQKFVSQFISPNTPYNGILLYHGVGVGKTCSAILAAEAFLQLSPKNKVYILAPPAIQAGFYRTIFDPSRIVFGKDADQPNTHDGCTGNRYLELTQTLYEREKRDIELRVNRLINKRYAIMGYVAFRNMVRDIKAQIPSTLSPKRKEEQNTILLQRALSGCFFIVDEAHNLRDVSEGADDDDDDDLGDRSDAAAGKKLTPMLREVLQKCEGNKLMLMSATPMYNSYREIISLLNLLLYVDKIPRREPGDGDNEIRLLTDSDIVFEKRVDEDGVEVDVLSKSSERKLVAIANSHVSFMRGENPKAFPARLDPSDDLRIQTWPQFSPNGTTELKTDEKKHVMQLPLVNCALEGEPLAVIKNMTERLIAAKGVGIRTIDTLLQAGNCIFPGEGLDGRVGSDGFQSWFSTRAVAGTFEGTRLSSLPQYVPAEPDESYSWMVASDSALGNASPKFNRVLKTIRSAEGISFVYSRFVENGAVIFCLLLEANGYSPWGRSAPMFSKGSLEGGKQCAKCDRKQAGHPVFTPGQEETKDNHKFSPAYYALLTASDVNTAEKQSLPLSPNNVAVINAARAEENKDGTKIKVVVGSQVAGEGLDLRYIREVHILEGWFHLSKEEQIVGRGIRYCSHNALPRAKRNCTINLYVNTFPAELNKETIDQYSYRTAMNKAVRVGNVSRALKMGAADCNLNRDAILVTGLTRKPALDEKGNPNMLDSQGKARPVDLNDKDYTPTCDWIACHYTCKPGIDLSDKKEMPDDNGTYDMFAARFAEQMLIQKLRVAFKNQPWYHWDKLAEIFKDVPKATLTSLLLKIVNNQSLVFENGNLQGHIIFRNNLFLFQPNKIQDGAIPISFRYGKYPVKRDYYEPEMGSETKPQLKTMPMIQGQEPEVQEPESQEAEAVASKVAPIFWIKSVEWINSWCKDDNSINEYIPESYIDTIMEYVEGDTIKRDNMLIRLKKLQWWGKAIATAISRAADTAPGGIRDLRRVAKEFIWDSFLKGPEQISMIEAGTPSAEEAGSEQFLKVETSTGPIVATRYLDLKTKEPVYICGPGTPCPPSLMNLFTRSTTDPVVNAKANMKVSGSPYGFMVIWGNAIMFKLNDSVTNPEGKPPGGGKACSIVSNVTAHRKKLVDLGDILYGFTQERFDLTDTTLTSGARKLSGAPSYCALMEVIMRWMDIRKELYGGKRYFYRPLSSFYSKHKSKK